MKVLHLHRAEIHQALLLKFSKADSDCKPWLILTKVPIPITKPARLSYYLTQNLTILKGRELTENHFSSEYKLFLQRSWWKYLHAAIPTILTLSTRLPNTITLDVDMAHRNFPSHFHLHCRSKYYIFNFWVCTNIAYALVDDCRYNLNSIYVICSKLLITQIWPEF